MPNLRASAEFVSRDPGLDKCSPICDLSEQSYEPGGRSLRQLLSCRIRDSNRSRVSRGPQRIHFHNDRAALSRFGRGSRLLNNPVYLFNRRAIEFGDLRSGHPVIRQCTHAAQLRGGYSASLSPRHFFPPRRLWFGRSLRLRARRHARRDRQDTRLTPSLRHGRRGCGYRRQLGRSSLLRRPKQIFGRLAGAIDFFTVIAVVGRFPIGHKALLQRKSRC